MKLKILNEQAKKSGGWRAKTKKAWLLNVFLFARLPPLNTPHVLDPVFLIPYF
jgi:hypothetical protein